MGYNFTIMLNKMAIFALLIFVFSVQAYPQTDKAQDGTKQAEPPTPTAPIVPKQNNSQSLQPKAENHVQADVWVRETPPKDRYDKATFWVNFTLACIGLGGIIAAYKTIKKLERQTKAMEDTFIQTQRPKINVRTFYFHEPTSNMGQIPNGILAGSMLTGQFYIVNLGGTRATVKEIHYEFFVTGEPHLPGKRPWEGKDGVKREIAFEAGQSEPFIFGREEPLSDGQAFAIFSGQRRLYLMGWIDYVDGLKISRTTRFCRLYDPTSYRFTVVNDPEYESAD